MAPGDRPDLDRLTTAVNTLGHAIAAIEHETLDNEGLSLASSLVSRAANMLDGCRADLARRGRNLTPPGAPTPHHTLDPHHQRGARTVERDSTRADLYDTYTELGDATRRGELPGDYADTINTATTRLTDTERRAFDGRWRESLTKQALTMGLHEFRVHVRGLVDDVTRATELERHRRLRRQRTARIWTDPTDGMTKLFAAFDPETGARIRRTLDATIDRLHRTARDDPHDTRTHQQVAADAVSELLTGARAEHRSRTELVVLVDVDTLTGREASAGRCCETSDGTPLPVETVRRLACDADILPAVLNSDSVVLDFGRTQRLATADQRRALETMYATCAFDDCTVPFTRCEIHHLNPYGPPTNGPTDLVNLIPTCQRHHHHIHDHHLHLTLDPTTRTLTVTHPDGTHQHHHPHHRRRPPPHAA